MTVPASSLSAMARFTLVINGLVHAVVARSGSRVLTDAMIMLLTGRIVALSHVVRRLVLAIETGTLRTRRSPAPGCTRRPATPRAVVLPRGYAWLLKLMGSDAAVFGGRLRSVLDDPEMTALLAASPRLVRTLRPLCRMLGVDMPTLPDPVPPPVLPEMPPGGGTQEAGAGDMAFRAGVSSGRSDGAGARRGRDGRRGRKRTGGRAAFARPIRFG